MNKMLNKNDIKVKLIIATAIIPAKVSLLPGSGVKGIEMV